MSKLGSWPRFELQNAGQHAQNCLAWFRTIFHHKEPMILILNIWSEACRWLFGFCLRTSECRCPTWKMRKTTFENEFMTASSLLARNWMKRVYFLSYILFSNFSCMFLNHNHLNSNCSSLLYLRNLKEQVKKAFCYQRLFWLFNVWINCSSDLKKFSDSPRIILSRQPWISKQF